MDLTDEHSEIRNNFQLSQLQKCVVNESAVVPLDDNQIDDLLNYMERPVTIIDRKTEALLNKEVSLVKVQWQHHKSSKWTWEPEAEMREQYPNLFVIEVFKEKI